MTEPRLLTVEQVAKRLGISPRTIYNGVSKATKVPFPIRAVRIRRLVRFKEQDLIDYIESL